MYQSHRQSTRTSFGHRRKGISLFEVLVSIMVAGIGLLGVLVLIPFAVKTSERGLDQEAALTHARNSFADFEANGYRNTSNWINPDSSVIDSGTVYCIDPIRVARKDTYAGTTTDLVFPYTFDPSGGVFPDSLNIPVITLEDSASSELSLALSRRIFSAPDDLLFDDSPDSDIAGPTQRYFQDGVSNVKRQNVGRISSMMFAIPDGNIDGQWTLYTVVMKDRTIDPVEYAALRTGGNYDPASADAIPPGIPRVFELTEPPVVNSNVSETGYGGGDVEMTELNQPPQEEPEIRNNDWVILLNGPATSIVPPTQDIQNIGFFRVISSDIDGTTHRVTLQGPDFNFTDNVGFFNPDPDGNPSTPPPPVNTKTYAILIPNVIAVFERTIREETESPFNN